MPLSAYQVPVASDPTLHFLPALTTNQISANVDLVLPMKQAYWFIRAITLVSVQNLDWELWLFSRAANLGTTFVTDFFLGVWQFQALSGTAPAAPGFTVAPANGDPLLASFHYYVDGNMFPYLDLDQQKTYPTQTVPGGAAAHIHCRLVNRSVTAKSVDADGALKVTFHVAQQGLQA